MVFSEVGWLFWGTEAYQLSPYLLQSWAFFTRLLDPPEQFGSSCRLN